MIDYWLLGFKAVKMSGFSHTFVRDMFTLAIKNYKEGWILDYWRGAADAVLSAYGF